MLQMVEGPLTTHAKPTIILVHGSYHTPFVYFHLIQRLRDHDFQVHCPQLPTADPRYLVADPTNPDLDQPPPPGGLPDQVKDVEVIEPLLESAVERGEDVLIVAHSSGGWTGCECSKPRFQREQRRKEGKKGGIVGIFFMASFLIMPGESVWSTFSKGTEHAAEDYKLPPCFEMLSNGTLTIVSDPLHYFFHDLDRDAAERLIPTLTACGFMTTPLTTDAYVALPCAYMICEGDRCLPSSYQEVMIKSADERGGKKMKVYKCTGGHESFLSQPEVYVKDIQDFARLCA